MGLRLTATEHEHQVRVIDHCALKAVRNPDYGMIFAIPNAGAGAQRGQAGKMKAEGVKSGVPDLFVCLPRNGYHGLFLEMKAVGGRVSAEQIGWIARLSMAGYLALVCYGADEAIKAIEDYFRGDK